MKITWGDNNNQERQVTLPQADIDKVKTIVRCFPVEYADGTHCVRVAIHRLYEEKKKEWDAKEIVRKNTEAANKAAEPPKDILSPENFFGRPGNNGGWQ